MDDIKKIVVLAENIVEEYGSLANLILNNNFDYEKYLNFSDDSYKKTLICSGKGIDVYIICWKIGQCSEIHSHPEKGCTMIVLEGALEEITYTQFDYTHYLSEIDKRIIKTNDSAYNHGSKILHQIRAISDTVSLHVYHNS